MPEEKRVDEKLAQEAFSVGKRFVELFPKLESAVLKELLPKIEVTWYECYELTLAEREEQEKYGEDALFVFPAFDNEKKVHLEAVVKRDGSIQLFYRKRQGKAGGADG